MRRPTEQRLLVAAAMVAAAVLGTTTAAAACTICVGDDGSAASSFNDTAPLALPPPFDFVQTTCGAFETLAEALGEAQCRVVQKMGSLCGCGTRTEASCHLCGDREASVPAGFKATVIDIDANKAAALDPDLGPAFAAGLAPRCEMMEAYLFSFDEGEDKCEAFRDLVGSQCGCGGLEGEVGDTPEPSAGLDEPAVAVAGTCNACPGGVADPGQVMDYDFIPFQNFLRLLPGQQLTCGIMEMHVDSLPADDPLCNAATAYSYLCGCNGGVHPYLGADTVREQAALAWLPRASGLLSVIGSLLIIRDVAKDRRNLRSLRHQLILGMSVGDVVVSIAQGLSSLPIPKYHPFLGFDQGIYGAEGNEGTCTAQGFFVQLGYTSVFFNLALSTNYLLTIKYGMRESQIAQYRLLFLLPPPLVGLALAFGGIPFYDNIMLMCHVPPPYDLYLEGLEGVDVDYSKTSGWGPIVALSIVPLTISMAAGCANMIAIYWSVRQQERRRRRWMADGDCGGNSMSRSVLMQAALYTGSFLLCWVLYYVANFKSDEFWEYYVFWASLALLSPLMGFCNCLVYFRPRMAKALATWRAGTSVRRGRRKTASKEGAEAGMAAATAGAAAVMGTGGRAQEAPRLVVSEAKPESDSN